MSDERIDSFTLHCDDCGDAFEGCEGWDVWAEAEHAREAATDYDWCIRPGLDLCVSCSEKNPFCRDEDEECTRRDVTEECTRRDVTEECTRRDVTEADDGWRYCPEHIGQGMDAAAVTP